MFRLALLQAAYATLDTVQFYFLYQSCPVWYNCLSAGLWRRGYISLRSAWSTKIYDILNTGVSKWIGNMAHNLEYLFNSASRQHKESGLCSYPFITILRTLFLPLKLAFIIESTGGAGFYSNVFVVPRYTGGLWSILNLKQINHNMNLSTFKMHSIRQVQQHVWQEGYAFSIDYKDVYLPIHIV